MSPSGRPHSPIEHLLRLFPAETAAVRRLYLADVEFRSICDDYALARETVSHMVQRRPGGWEEDPRAIDDYRVLIAALELELGRYIAQSRRGPHLRDPSA